ncbi:MAG TPA: NAD-dependent succinate-semialdehyde dehydrogenase [Candidatus Sulfotelmatobacter sp.]|nr:NAD-dependent succinate-semialdehyde dehydrogenase [Candidatus Sulfotelmatobacter sp.]
MLLSAPTLEVKNPSTGAVVGTVPRCGADETRAAIDAAAAALPAWRARTAADRGKLVRAIGETMLARTDALARLLTSEQGKPLAEARGEIAYAASFFEWFAEEGKRAYGEIIPTDDRSRRLFVQKEAVGVCAAITPWNFPSAMLTRKIAPALAAGCTIVVKPAEQTPLSALAILEIAREVGVPDGVIGIVTGAAEDAPVIGEILTTDPRVRKVSFTGSTEVGKLLMRQSSSTLKRLSLELGGNAPFIVLDDADLDAAVQGAIASKYRNAGQTCVCANRFYVQDGVYDAFATKLTAAAKQLRVGDGFEAGVHIGPLIDYAALAKVEAHVADARTRGARTLLGGTRDARGGTFFTPTVIADVPADALLAREETFGPVAGLVRFTRDEEAYALANDTPFGLAAYVYGRDAARLWRAAEALEYGMVGANAGIISTAIAPFGGVKESGFGREGSHYGLDEWLSIKYICLGGLA